jgi:hypothetical protein
MPAGSIESSGHQQRAELVAVQGDGMRAAVVIGHLPAGLRPGGLGSCESQQLSRKPMLSRVSPSQPARTAGDANSARWVQDRRPRARTEADVGAHHRAQISRFGTVPAPLLRDAVQIR